MKLRTLLLALCYLTTVMAGCESENSKSGDGSQELHTGEISLLTSRDIIEADGCDVAHLRVWLATDDGSLRDVTSEAEIYCEGSDTPITDPDYRATAAGRYNFYAIYGFEISNSVCVEAVDGLASLPEDGSKERLDFQHRILLLQHTGTGCPNCPTMMSVLKALADDAEYNTLYYHVASHSYNAQGDAAYSSAAAQLSRTFNTEGWYPWLTFNLTDEYAHELEDIVARVGELHRDSADAGVSIASTVIEDRVYATVGLKVAKSNSYRIAVWLLEDGIQAKQSGAVAQWQNQHDNCLREMSGEDKTTRIYGRLVGELTCGESITHVASMALKSGWEVENCELFVAVTADNGRGRYELVNCAVCPINGAVDYHYN